MSAPGDVYKRQVYVEHMLRQPLPTDAVWSGRHSLDFALDRVCPQATASAIVTGRDAGKLPFADAGSWPGRAKAESKLAAVNQSSKTGQPGKF